MFLGLFTYFTNLKTVLFTCFRVGTLCTYVFVVGLTGVIIR